MRCRKLTEKPLLGHFGSLVWVMAGERLHIAHADMVNNHMRVPSRDPYLKIRIRELYDNNFRYSEIASMLGVSDETIFKAIAPQEQGVSQ